MREMRRFKRDGTRLSYEDFGGSGAPLLLLHGLAGYAGEWRRSAELLAARYRVLVLISEGMAAASGSQTMCRARPTPTMLAR